MAAIAEGVRSALAKAGGGSVLIIPSRRTDPWVGENLEGRLEGLSVYLWKGSDPNPYRDVLDRADYLCVTQDSVSMLSEACYTGRPVYLMKVTGHSDRLAAFHASLLADNHARGIDDFEVAWKPERLDEMSRLAEEIANRLGSGALRERGGREGTPR